MKPVLTNKDHINNKEIIIKKGSKTINEGRELSEAFKQVLCKFCGKYIYNQWHNIFAIYSVFEWG